MATSGRRGARAARRSPHAPDVVASHVEPCLEPQEGKGLLRFITCGSVDDGKSTLIGRLLYEANILFDDQLAALEADSRKIGTQGGNLDFALLLDGLTAEREGVQLPLASWGAGTRRLATLAIAEQMLRSRASGAG